MLNWSDFFAKRSEPTDSGCFEWQRGGLPSGYGLVREPTVKRQWLAHRLAYEKLVGKIPDGMYVCHKCDNPKCINPDHLFVGTAKDNAADKVAKGRQPRGDETWMRKHPERVRRGSRAAASKLIESSVLEIRKLLTYGEKPASIARKYGVSQNIIGRIRDGKIWCHV